MRVWLISGLLGFAFITSLGAVEIEGVAAYESGDLEKTRALAVKDALRQASLNVGAIVKVRDSLNRSGKVEQAVHLSPTGGTRNYTVLNEWAEGGLYHVLLDVKATEADQCGNYMGGHKRKVTATSFNVDYRPMDFVPNIRSGFPEELLRRLEESGAFLPRNVSLAIGHPPFRAQPDALSNMEPAREVAFATGSQFVLSGVIDAGVGRSDYGHWIEAEVDVYDGLTGILIARRRQGMSISNEKEIETGSLFGSAKFYSTPFGKQFDAFMKVLVKDLERDLRCQPFMAKITDIDNRKVYIDAGAVSKVVPGEEFIAYQSKRRPQSESAANRLLGFPTIPVTTLTIKQVFPLFSIGKLSVDPKNLDLRVGDFVRVE